MERVLGMPAPKSPKPKPPRRTAPKPAPQRIQIVAPAPIIDCGRFAATAEALETGTGEEAHQAALEPELLEAVGRHPDRRRATTMDRELHVDADPQRARFGTWYELFPRSWGGLQGVTKRIPELAELG